MLSKIDHFLKAIVGMAVIIIILYEIDGIKNSAKGILLFMESNHILLGIPYSKLVGIITMLRRISLVYILFYLLYLSISWLLNMLLDSRINHRDNKVSSVFESSLIRYLKDKHGKKAYLVTGDWGSGKTYVVTEFFKKYYKYSNRKIYRISCFGLETREQVLREIREQVERDDNSLVNMVQYIPLIGQPVYSFLKGSFSFNNIKKNSIFIFDDFERITAIGLTKSNLATVKYSNNSSLYRTSHSLKRKLDSNDLVSEFENIEKAMQKIREVEEEKYLSDNFQKYNIVTGVINDLVDSYKLKVIILCNIDILGYGYLDLIFRGKLDCVTYAKTVDFATINSVLSEVCDNQIFNNEKDKEIIEEFCAYISEDFEKVIKSYGRTNLRYVRTASQAFVETVNLLMYEDNIEMDKGYLTSLFYSIFISKSLYDESDFGFLSNFEIGGNLCFYLDIYSKDQENSLLKAISNSRFSAQIRWVGLSISTFWIMNMRKPQNNQSCFETYYKYSHDKKEYELFEGASFNHTNSYLIEHISFLLKNSRRAAVNKDEDNHLRRMIIEYLDIIDIDDLLLSNEDMNDFDIVDSLLNKIYDINRAVIFTDVYTCIFTKLYMKHTVHGFIDKTYIHIKYDEVVKKILDGDNINTT